MPDLIMLTEVAFLSHSYFSSRNKRPCPADKQFETFTHMLGLKLNVLELATLKPESCARCVCRKPCRRWLRTGVFNYAGDPRCPSAALLTKALGA